MSEAQSFIVRVSVAEDGRLVGVVERVKTGRKEQVRDAADIGRVIAAMARSEPMAKIARERGGTS